MHHFIPNATKIAPVYSDAVFNLVSQRIMILKLYFTAPEKLLLKKVVIKVTVKIKLVR